MHQTEDRIAIYSRKSRFTGKGESIGNQSDLCKAYVRNAFGEGYEERCVVFEDEGFSGGNLQRPDFLRMMEEVRKHRFRAIVVYRLDRISRNISDFTGLIDELTKLDVSFISIREQFDTGSPMGRAMMFIISVFSQLERETIAQRIRDNMRELAKTGRWLGGNTPTGFCSGPVSKITVDGKERRSYKLIPIPGEIGIPRQIFDLYGELGSLTGVEAELLRLKVRTKQGKDYTRFAIKGILQNPVYMTADEGAYHYFLEKGAEVCCRREDFDGSRGIMAYNRTSQEKGRATRLLPMSQWIIAIGKHPGLIPSKQWIGVQESLERNKSGAYRKPRKNEALLTGLLWCSCGERMHPKLSRQSMTSGARTYSYVCGMKARSKGERCSRRNISGNALDGAILEKLASLKADPGILVSQLEKKGRFLNENGRENRQLPDALRQEYLQRERKIEGLLDSLEMAERYDGKDRILRRIGELSRENDAAAEQLRELEKKSCGDTLSDTELEMLRQEISGFRTGLEDLPLREKRTAVSTLVRKVIWDGENAHVVLFGAEETHWGEDSK